MGYDGGTPFRNSAKTKNPEALLDDDDRQIVKPADKNTELINLYFIIPIAEPSLTVNSVIDTYTVTVNDATDIVEGLAINIIEGGRQYQSIILDVTGLVLTLASPLDYAFTTDADVIVGDWKLNVDGSVTPVIAKAVPPGGVKYTLREMNVNITDETVMDSAKFGGIAALTKGMIVRYKDTIYKNFLLVVNNIGFAEQGFTLFYDPKAPSGVYGLRCEYNSNYAAGTNVLLDGDTSAELQIIIQDDLTDLTLMSATIQGHVVEE